MVDSCIDFVNDKTEWNGTDIIFVITRKGNKTELRFTHAGLVPAVECYGKCVGAWSFYIGESLRDLITTGTGDPIAKDRIFPVLKNVFSTDEFTPSDRSYR